MLLKVTKLPLIGFLLVSQLIIAQIGISTTDPEADLHVAGDLLVQEGFWLTSLPIVTNTEEDFKLISRVNGNGDLGEIKELDVRSLKVAPINTVDYHFANISSDNLSDVDLQYDADKYIVGVSNFRYVGDGIDKVNLSSSQVSIGEFVVHTFVSAGTWHLEIQNRMLDLSPSRSVEYYITLIVYDKSYFRDLPSISTNMGNSTNGTASSVPVFN